MTTYATTPNLRWLIKPDGTRVLQQMFYVSSSQPVWFDVTEVVETKEENA